MSSGNAVKVETDASETSVDIEPDVLSVFADSSSDNNDDHTVSDGVVSIDSDDGGSVVAEVVTDVIVESIDDDNDVGIIDNVEEVKSDEAYRIGDVYVADTANEDESGRDDDVVLVAEAVTYVT